MRRTDEQIEGEGTILHNAQYIAVDVLYTHHDATATERAICTLDFRTGEVLQHVGLQYNTMKSICRRTVLTEVAPTQIYPWVGSTHGLG